MKQMKYLFRVVQQHCSQVSEKSIVLPLAAEIPKSSCVEHHS